MSRARGKAAYLRRDRYGVFRQPKYKCGCCEKLAFKAYGVRQNFYLFNLYLDPDLDDRIYDCLQKSIDAVQAEDVRFIHLQKTRKCAVCGCVF